MPVHGVVHGATREQRIQRYLQQVSTSSFNFCFYFFYIVRFRLILPAYKKHSCSIDQVIENAGSKAGDLFDKAVEKAKDYAAEQQLNKND